MTKIKNWYVTGDTHSLVLDRASLLLKVTDSIPEETALIILGDGGLNYFLNDTDREKKQRVDSLGLYVYIVKGNHEARPESVQGMTLIHDEEVGGPVWIEYDFPNIRYFCDWGLYTIQGRRILIIGGAYSVDKFYRLQNGWRWFKDEQLAPHERDACLRAAKDEEFDFILSHTCPLSLQPTDLFLRGLDQSTVDNSMEVWLEEVKNKVKWRHWLFAHYHADRIEWPHVEQFYTEVENIEDIEARWRKYDETGELDWWLPISPRLRRLMEGE